MAPEIENPAPVTVAALTVSGAVPDEARVTGSVAGVLTATLPKARLDALRLRAGVNEAMDSVRFSFPVPPLLVALSMIVDVPPTVGVPEISPVEVFTVSPAGSPVAPKPVGILVAAI